MPHYWFSHRANSHLNVPSQRSKADIIQPWPSLPAWHIEINVLPHKAAYSWALPLADGLIVVFFSIFFFPLILLISQVYKQKLFGRAPASGSSYLDARKRRICGAFYLFIYYLKPFSLCGALREVLRPRCVFRCCLGEKLQQTLKVKGSPVREKRRCGMKMKTATAEFVARGVKDQKCPPALEAWRFRVIGSPSICRFQIDLKPGKSCVRGATLGYGPATVSVASVKDRVGKRKVQIATSNFFFCTPL